MTTQDTTYNGWTNRETWNTQLWITNDYGTYKTIMELYRTSKNEGDLADSMEYYLNLIWDFVTPDGVSLNPVNWAELGDSWYEDNKP